MSGEPQGPLTRTTGTEAEILLELWKRCLTDTDSAGLAAAVEQLQQGHRVVEAYGQRFEVTDADWSVVQDVYGCEKGRDCSDVTAADRAAFEVMITARLEAGG